jgi:hypothetical protein
MLPSKKSVRKYFRKLSSNCRSFADGYVSHNCHHTLQVSVRGQLHLLRLRGILTIELSWQQTWLQSRFSQIIRGRFLAQLFAFGIICFVKLNILITRLIIWIIREVLQNVELSYLWSLMPCLVILLVSSCDLNACLLLFYDHRFLSSSWSQNTQKVIPQTNNVAEQLFPKSNVGTLISEEGCTTV